MRCDDVFMAKQVPVTHMSAEMYVPGRTRLEDMQPDMLKRLLCQKNLFRDWKVCQSCRSGCRAGNLLVGMMTGKTPLPVVPLPSPAAVRIEMPTKVVKRDRRPVRKPSAALIDRLKEASEEILQGADRAVVADKYGYKSWDTLRDAMKRLCVDIPPLRADEKDRSKYWQHVQQLQEAAIAKVIKARQLVAQGMEREKAARAVGYSRWDTVHGVYKKHKDEVDRRERA